MRNDPTSGRRRPVSSKTKKLPRQGRISIPKRFPMRYQDEVWSLDWTIANFVLPRLRYFRECHGGHPGDLTEAEWLAHIDKMLAAFALVAEGAWDIVTPTDRGTVNGGLFLFARYFTSLWN